MRLSYQRGDVLLVEMPFTDGPGEKKCPAVVLSTEAFNRAGIKLIVAAITTNLIQPSRPGDIILSDWQGAGLLLPCAVRGYLGMVDQRRVGSRLGTMPTADFSQVERGIATISGSSLSRNT